MNNRTVYPPHSSLRAQKFTLSLHFNSRLNSRSRRNCTTQSVEALIDIHLTFSSSQPLLLLHGDTILISQSNLTVPCPHSRHGVCFQVHSGQSASSFWSPQQGILV